MPTTAATMIHGQIKPGPYEGPWQLSLRDIDPSITFEPVKEPFHQSPVMWRQPLSVEIGRFVDHRARAEWSVVDTDAPSDTDLRRLLQVTHPDRSAWLTLEGGYGWEEEQAKHLQSTGSDRAVLWLQIRSYVIPRRFFREFMQWARRQDWYGRWMPEGASISEAYLGEWPWHPSIRAYADELCEIGDWAETGEAPTGVLPTWVDYKWERSDASIPEGASTVLPAQWLVTSQNLRKILAISGVGALESGTAGLEVTSRTSLH